MTEKPLLYAPLTDNDWRALQLLVEQKDLVGPNYFGTLLWPRSPHRSNCSAPLARPAGNVLNRLKARGLAEWIMEERASTDRWGWRVTEKGRRLYARHREQGKRHPEMYR